ncbi:MAG: hypothetical protein GPJ54_19800 [Candidatus Heimdallarchaeota archaeon]|nr:hypothetical protein [Candidatus Heimdallarchaeota archaeon]
MRLGALLLILILTFPIMSAEGAYANCGLNELCYDENLDFSKGDAITWSYLSALRDGERQQDDEGRYVDNMIFQVEINIDIRGFSSKTLGENSQYAFTVSSIYHGNVIQVNSYNTGIGFIYRTINNTEVGPVNYLIQYAEDSPYTLHENEDRKNMINKSIIDGFLQTEYFVLELTEATNEIIRGDWVVERINLKTGLLDYRNATYLQDGVLSNIIIQLDGIVSDEIRLGIPFPVIVGTGIMILVISSVILYFYLRRQER